MEGIFRPARRVSKRDSTDDAQEYSEAYIHVLLRKPLARVQCMVSSSLSILYLPFLRCNKTCLPFTNGRHTVRGLYSPKVGHVLHNGFRAHSYSFPPTLFSVSLKLYN